MLSPMVIHRGLLAILVLGNMIHESDFGTNWFLSCTTISVQFSDWSALQLSSKEMKIYLGNLQKEAVMI